MNISHDSARSVMSIMESLCDLIFLTLKPHDIDMQNDRNQPATSISLQLKGASTTAVRNPEPNTICCGNALELQLLIRQKEHLLFRVVCTYDQLLSGL